jgi:hypothetical protein
MSAKNCMRRSSSRPDFLFCQPSGIAERLHNIFALQIGKVSQDFVPGSAVGYLSDDDRDGDSHASDARSASEDFWVKCDSIKHGNRPINHARFYQPCKILSHEMVEENSGFAWPASFPEHLNHKHRGAGFSGGHA